MHSDRTDLVTIRIAPVPQAAAVTHDEHLSNRALLRFAHDIALHYDLEPLAVVDEMMQIDQCFLDLAKKPLGLTSLAAMLGMALNSDIEAPFIVTVH